MPPDAVRNETTLTSTSFVRDADCYGFIRIGPMVVEVAFRGATEPWEDRAAREEAAFWSLLPSLVRQYSGQFVAVSGNRVVDAGESRPALARRFFDRYGDDAPVYIGYVGTETPDLQATPLTAR